MSVWALTWLLFWGPLCWFGFKWLFRDLHIGLVYWLVDAEIKKRGANGGNQADVEADRRGQ